MHRVTSGIIQRNTLSVVNNSKDKCVGKFRRQRSTHKRKEASIKDFVIGCDYINDMTTQLKIDEKREHVIISFRKNNEGTKVNESNHNSLITNSKTVWKKKQPKQRSEIYNLKNEIGLNLKGQLSLKCV